MSSTEALLPLLRKLRLSGVLETLDLRRQQALEEDLPLDEFLFRLFGDEVERRDTKQLQLRLRKPNFEHARTLETFDWTFNPQLPKGRFLELATCQFIPRHENVLLLGQAGVGKSHLAQALGNRACRLGYSVLFTCAEQLFAQLRASRADHSFERKLLTYTRPDLLLIDDLGLRPLKYDEPLDLYELFRRRYERGATILTSNRAIEELHPLWGEPLLASSAMDRLLHHAHVFVLQGESYRTSPRARRGRPPSTAPTQTSAAG